MKSFLRWRITSNMQASGRSPAVLLALCRTDSRLWRSRLYQLKIFLIASLLVAADGMEMTVISLMRKVLALLARQCPDSSIPLN